MSRHDFMIVGDKYGFDPENCKPRSQNGLRKRHPETHVNVLIVGPGYAGLMTVLECWRKGHNVVGVLERNIDPNSSGPLIHLSLEDLTYGIFRRPYHRLALSCIHYASLA